FVSWLHPFKEQKLAIVGSRKMAVFDDVEPERKLTLYSHRIDWLNRMPVARRDSGQIAPLAKGGPLHRECEHLLDCVRTRHTTRSDGESGARVLEVPEACENSLRKDGLPATMQRASLPYYAHPSAVIDDGAEVGEGTTIWHFSHLMTDSRLGKNCNLGQNVVISPGLIIATNLKLHTTAPLS